MHYPTPTTAAATNERTGTASTGPVRPLAGGLARTGSTPYPDRVAKLVSSEPLIGPGPTEVRSLEVWQADDGSTVALVTEVRGERSLMNANASGRLVREIQALHPGARVIEYWPGEGDWFGPYREADDGGGSRKIDSSALRDLGIPTD